MGQAAQPKSCSILRLRPQLLLFQASYSNAAVNGTKLPEVDEKRNFSGGSLAQYQLTKPRWWAERQGVVRVVSIG